MKKKIISILLVALIFASYGTVAFANTVNISAWLTSPAWVTIHNGTGTSAGNASATGSITTINSGSYFNFKVESKATGSWVAATAVVALYKGSFSVPYTSVPASGVQVRGQGSIPGIIENGISGSLTF